MSIDTHSSQDCNPNVLLPQRFPCLPSVLLCVASSCWVREYLFYVWNLQTSTNKMRSVHFRPTFSKDQASSGQVQEKLMSPALCCDHVDKHLDNTLETRDLKSCEQLGFSNSKLGDIFEHAHDWLYKHQHCYSDSTIDISKGTSDVFTQNWWWVLELYQGHEKATQKFPKKHQLIIQHQSP